MATSFVEQATLRVNDQSSAKIKKINAELTKLLATAKKLKNLKLNLKIDPNTASNARKVNTELNKMAKTAEKLKGTGGRGAKIFDQRNITDASRKLRQLDADLKKVTGGRSSRGINLRVNTNSVKANLDAAATSFSKRFAAGVKGGFDPVNMGFRMASTFSHVVGAELTRLAGRIVQSGARGIVSQDAAEKAFRVSGRSESELDIARDIARDVSSKYPTSTVAAVLDNARDVTGQIGDLNEPANAEDFRAQVDSLAKSAAILANGARFQPDDAAEQARRIEQVISQLGATGTAEAPEIRKAALQAIIGSGGDVSGMELKRIGQHIGGLRNVASGLTILQAALQRDEGGARATGELRQAYGDLTRGNLFDTDKAQQIAAGLRDKQGNPLYGEALGKDALGFATNVLIPKLEALGVDINNAQEVSTALDNKLGFVSQGGISTLTNMITNRDQLAKEVARALKADLEYAADNPTVDAQLAAVNSQFQNLFAAAAAPLLPAAQNALDSLTGMLTSFSEGGATGSLVGLGIAAAPLGISAGLNAMLDPMTRPLGAAGLALSSSAAALTGAASALTAAAVAEGGIESVTKVLGPGLLSTLLGAAATGVVASGAAVVVADAIKSSALNKGEDDMIRRIYAGTTMMDEMPDTVANTVQRLLDNYNLRAGPAMTNDPAVNAINQATSVTPLPPVTTADFDQAAGSALGRTWDAGREMLSQAFGFGSQDIAKGIDTGATAGAASLEASGPVIGNSAASALQAAAPSIGQAIAASVASSVAALVAGAGRGPLSPPIPGNGTLPNPLDTGNQPPTAE